MIGPRRVLRCARVFTLVLLAFLVSCGGDEGGGSASPGDWKLVLADGGGSVVLPLQICNVWLVEDDYEAESYNIEGPGVAIGGRFPAGLHVGYGENWNVLLGKTIVVTAGTGNSDEPGAAFVELTPGARSSVEGGTIVFEELSGKTNGADGDITLRGRVMLVVRTDAGTKNLMGTISVHCVTWG